MDKAALLALAGELERAEGGSRELDARMLLAVVDPLESHPGWQREITDCLARGVDPDPWKWAHRAAPHFSLMLDAALPGKEIVGTSRWPSGTWQADHAGRMAIGMAATEPLARRAAALRAMLHENPDDA